MALVQASVLAPPMFMAHEPHTPSRQERRKALCLRAHAVDRIERGETNQRGGMLHFLFENRQRLVDLANVTERLGRRDADVRRIIFRRLRDRCGCRRGLFLSLFSRTAA